MLAARLVLHVILVLFAFWLGMQLGEIKSYMRHMKHGMMGGYGYNHMYSIDGASGAVNPGMMRVYYNKQAQVPTTADITISQ